MPSSPFLGARLRAVSVVSICAALAALASITASRQHAGAPTSAGSFVVGVAPDKGIITPQAITITVNSLSDVANNSDGSCTLREAITAANNNVASGAAAGECAAGDANVADTINFTVTGTIDLGAVLPSIGSNMSISGPGSGSLTVRRNTGGDYRIFFIVSNQTVSISGLTISNGKTADGAGNSGQGGENGGGIFQSSGLLNLSDVVVSGNRTGNGGPNSTSNFGSGGVGGLGGGIYSTGTLTANNVTVTMNTTGNGGPYSVPSRQGFAGTGGSGAGIHSTGTLTLTNSVISNNTTGNGGNGPFAGSGGQGGGIWFGTATIILQNVTVSGNLTGGPGVSSAGGLGPSSGVAGGIFTGGSGASPAGTVTIMTNVTIANNATGNSPGEVAVAGGLYMASGQATLTNCTIRNNRNGNSSSAGGGRGGGIYNTGTTTLINSLVSGNSTGNGSPGDNNDGGGIRNHFIFNLINSTVSGNTTGAGAGGGGGISNSGNMTIANSTITGNSATSTAFHGVTGGPKTIVINSIIAGNGPGGGGPDVSTGFFNGTFTSRGHNLIGNGDGLGAFVNGANGDQVGTGASPLNPRLGPLADNGGPTLTHALLSNSTALDAGDNCVVQPTHCDESGIPQLTSDQRGAGFGRIVDGPDVDTTATVDIGAYETQPVLANLIDTSTNEDTQISVPFDAGDTSTIISVGATSSNPTLVPNDAAHLSAAIKGSTGVVTINPASNLFGTTDITVTVNRTGGSENKTFTLTVNSLNDAPSFTKGPDQTVNEDAGAQTVINWATNISPGPPDESGQTLTVQITGNTNASLFSAAPALSSNGTLTYTPAANANGFSTITVTLMDSGGTANGGADTSSQTFFITINSVNDVPSFTKGSDRTLNEDAGGQTTFSWATNISAGPSESNQALNFLVTNNTNPTLFSTAPIVSSTGILSFTAASHAHGSATITLVLKDSGGTANGGIDTSAPQTFTITVNPVNDVPSFTRGANQTVLEDAGPQTVSNWATAISPGPANESGQSVSFNITSNSNPTLFSTAPAVSATGALTYTTAANANGSVTIAVVIKDDGGTANGGTDTSFSQNFTITVTAVNDAPSFTAGPNQTVNEDAGAQSVTNWATGISRGAANESAQTVTFTATNDKNALFAVQPVVNSIGTLSYTLAAGTNGTTTVSVTLKDNGGTANGGADTSAPQTFTITVNPVNDAPSFTKGADQTVSNNAGMQTVSNWATNISTGPVDESTQTPTFLITGNTNPNLFSTAPAISSSGTLTYQPATDAGGTATISVVLEDSGGTANGGIDKSPAQSFVINVNPIGGSISFASPTLNPTESSGFVTVTVKRTGDTSQAVTVDYATSGDNDLPCATANGVATPKCDFTSALGTLNFAPNEDTKTFRVLIGQDSYVEGPEIFTASLLNQTGGSGLGPISTLTVTIDDDPTEPSMNASDDADAFVRQHYHDFLNREPDGPGLAFWVSQITSCGSDAACIENKRVSVSAAFFLSIEFQQTGYLVERTYKSAYGDATGTSTFPSSHQLSVPIVRLDEFLRDTQRIGKGVIVLQPGWELVLENNKRAYAEEFVQTSRFTALFPASMTPAQFVDTLFSNAGVTPSAAERNAAISEFGSATTSADVQARSRALRNVAENPTLVAQEFNRAFVLMEYFGYLRRNPDDAPEVTRDHTGYDFWLTKLTQFNGNYIDAEIVKAFISSIEYRQRFGP